jgi:hypothetical protein
MNLGISLGLSSGLQPLFSPQNLLAGSTALVWLDFSDLTTLFQDAAGTTPVTAPGQPVGLALDKSQGLVLGPELVTNGGPFVNTTGWGSSGSNLSVVSGKLRVEASNIGGAANLTLTTVANTFYQVSVSNVDNVSSHGWDIGFGGTFLPASSITTAANGSLTVLFLASGTSTTLALRSRLSSSAIVDFGSISVRELPGFHATASGTSRPTYGVVPSRGRVNLLTRTEEFDDAVWGTGLVSATPNTVAAPDGTVTADTLGFGASAASRIFQTIATATTSYTFSIWLRADTPQTVRVGIPLSTMSTVSVTTTWQRFSFTISATSSPTSFGLQNATDALARSVYAWGAQLETGSTASPYQRVGSQFDVTDPVGFPSYPCHYLGFDGVDDFMQTPTITPNADKVQVFAGVRKLSDGNWVLAETSTSAAGNNGAFAVYGTTGDRYGLASRGTSLGAASTTSSVYNAPITNVLTGLGDISGDLATLRIDSTQVAQSTADQGTGNYLAYPLYIGRRGGTSNPFNGQLFGLVVRFSTANLDAGLISQTERWMAGKTAGVTIA